MTTVLDFVENVDRLSRNSSVGPGREPISENEFRYNLLGQFNKLSNFERDLATLFPSVPDSLVAALEADNYHLYARSYSRTNVHRLTDAERAHVEQQMTKIFNAKGIHHAQNIIYHPELWSNLIDKPMLSQLQAYARDGKLDTDEVGVVISNNTSDGKWDAKERLTMYLAILKFDMTPAGFQRAMEAADRTSGSVSKGSSRIRRTR